MRNVSEEEKLAQEQRMNARAVKNRAQRELDEQRVPWNEKKYLADAEEILILLDAGADVVSHKTDGGKTFIRLMYEGIPVEYEADEEFIHPRLPQDRKAG